MTDQERKNFSQTVIDDTYLEQGGMCGKCGKALIYGYHAHHKNCDNSDNSKENCQLLCKSCHGGEQYATLLKQKEGVIADLDALIKNETVSGATVDKKLDAIKLKLSLQGQIYDDPPLEPPIQQRMKDYETVMQHGLQKYEEGVQAGFLKALDFARFIEVREAEKKNKKREE